MLSWRYLDHPQSGGAEVLTHEILKRCVALGWEATCFTAEYPGCARTGELDGVKLVRRGAQHTVHFHAWRWLRSRTADFDRVVEQINTVPFLTPFFVPAAKRRLFICQLAREFWFRETRGVFKLAAPFGYAIEPWQFQAYRKTATITISASTRDDLRALGVPVTTILPMAVHMPAVVELVAHHGPLRVINVGRLTPAKFVEEAIQAFAIVQADVPDATMDLVGQGDPAYRARLEALVARRGLRNVTFHGRVDEEQKRRLLTSAHVHVFTSHREGWGLTVTEAARVGTPSVGYDVPGVRDSIAEPRLIATAKTPEAIAARVLALWADPAGYDEVRKAAWRRAGELSWDRTAAAFVEAVA